MVDLEDYEPIGPCDFCGKQLDLQEAYFCDCGKVACRKCFHNKFTDWECPDCQELINESKS